MKTLIDALIPVYRTLLHLYPRSFWTEFHQEMEDVFDQRLAEASQLGAPAALSVFWREPRTLPPSVLREHRSALRARPHGAVMRGSDDVWVSAALSANHYGSWRKTFLAGLPFLFIGLGSIFATYLPYDARQVLFGVVLILLLLSSLAFAWTMGFPRWSYAYVLPVFGSSNWRSASGKTGPCWRLACMGCWAS